MPGNSDLCEWLERDLLSRSFDNVGHDEPLPFGNYRTGCWLGSVVVEILDDFLCILEVDALIKNLLTSVSSSFTAVSRVFFVKWISTSAVSVDKCIHLE